MTKNIKTLKISTLFLGLLFITSSLFAQTEELKQDIYVKLTTSYGEMVLKLYKETPLHSANFAKLVDEGYFDSLMFHRVIGDFMIQGGDPNSKNATPSTRLGSGSVGERIPAEFNSALYHKKGALAAARDNNPLKASSSCQFYIVDGKPIDSTQLRSLEQRLGITYTDEQIATYGEIGGTSFLDMNYTVFGEVVKGLEVIDLIAAVETAPGDRPKEDVRMFMELLPDYKKQN
jgi:cyclophilin family peptidyl-prolyl cis-trans isomerase